MQKPTNYMYALSRLIPSTCDITDLFNAFKLLKKEKLSLYRLKNWKKTFREFYEWYIFQ